MRLIKTIYIIPTSAPRQSRKDAWSPCPAVQRYRAFRDELCPQFTVEELPHHPLLLFHLPMPRSWSKRKQDRINGTPHTSKPDTDNLTKAFLDAIYRDMTGKDSEVWDVRSIKLWSDDPRIEVWGQECILDRLSELRGDIAA